MRALTLILGLMVAATASGCTDECEIEGQVKTDRLINAAPGAVMTMALAGCSTCGHTFLRVYWLPDGIDAATTGYVEITLSPQCLVRDTTQEAVPTAHSGAVDTNVKNCGEVVEYAAYVTNRTNVTLKDLSIDMTCPKANM